MKAMVLCAGHGTRLGSLTRAVPKPMLSLGGRPILEYILGQLRFHGFDRVMINLHFMPEKIRDHFGDGTARGLELSYSDEPVLLGTAGGLKNVESYFRGEGEFLVHYGDVVTDHDFGAMLAFHRQRQAVATLLVHQRAGSNSRLRLDPQGRILDFQERPVDAGGGAGASWVNSGVCIGSPGLLEAIPAGRACDLPRDIFPGLVATGRLFGFPLGGYRCAIDSPERLAQAEGAIARGEMRVRLEGPGRE